MSTGAHSNKLCFMLTQPTNSTFINLNAIAKSSVNKRAVFCFRSSKDFHTFAFNANYLIIFSK
jgi:hypothetical protein